MGAYVIIPWLNSVAIQPELTYVQKRSHSSSTTDVRLDYIEVPVLARMRVFKGIYATEGVAFGFPVKAEVVASSGATADIKSQITSPDVSIVIGGGGSIGIFGIEIRYEGGFRQIDTTSTATVQRTRNFMLLGRMHF